MSNQNSIQNSNESYNAVGSLTVKFDGFIKKTKKQQEELAKEAIEIRDKHRTSFRQDKLILDELLKGLVPEEKSK